MRIRTLVKTFAGAWLAAAWLHSALGQVSTTAFTYQGRLSAGSNNANGYYDFIFTLYDDDIRTNVVGGPLTNPPPILGPNVCPLCPVVLSDGLFQVSLDFGAAVFNGSNRWLGIQVRTNGSGPFTILSPRQPVTPAPYALYTPSAGLASIANGVSPSAIVQGQALEIGTGNVLTGLYATVAGGNGNTASNTAAVIGGGSANVAGGNHATVVGGESNLASGTHAFIGGGAFNRALSDYDVVVGGFSNSVSGDPSFIGAGNGNQVGVQVSPGVNQPNALNSWIAAGDRNAVFANYSGIGGGQWNLIQSNADYSFIGGGGTNLIQYGATGGVIGGGDANNVRANTLDATIGGGNSNFIDSNSTQATIGGGYGNGIWPSNPFATIAGGGGNNIQINSPDSTIAGGSGNQIRANSEDAAIGGGESNTIETNAIKSTIAGGYNNTIRGGADAIGGGLQNVAAGSYSTVPGGYANQALANFSFAAGDQAQVLENHPGTFVWADAVLGVNPDPFVSTAPNQFLIRATNGVGINKNNPAYALDVNGDLNISGVYRENGVPISSGSSPWLFGSSPGSIYYPGSHVGIGTADPQESLTIAGVATYNSGLKLTGDSSTGTGLSLENTSSVNAHKYDLLSSGLANGIGVGGFGIFDETLNLYRFAIDKSGNIGIGNNSTVVFSPSLMVSSSGNIGIGTRTPGAPLEIEGSTAFERLISTSATSGSVIELWNTAAGPNFFGAINFGDGSTTPGQIYYDPSGMYFRINGIPGVLELSSGTVGIDRLATSNALEVEGNASKTTAGGWLANSDARIKTRVETLSGALARLDGVRLVAFHYTEEYRNAHPSIEDREYVNVLAQEYAKVFPEYVKGSGEKLPNGDEILQVDTYPLIIYSTAAIQELDRSMREQAARIAYLEKKLAGEEKLRKGIEARLAVVEETSAFLAEKVVAGTIKHKTSEDK